MGADDDMAEARSVAVDAKNGAKKLDIGTGTPGVAVAACSVDIRGFAACRQAEMKIAPPYAQPIHIVVAESCFRHSLMGVELEVDGCRSEQDLIGFSVLVYGAGFDMAGDRQRCGTVDDTGEDGKSISVLREDVFVTSVGEQALLLPPVAVAYRVACSCSAR